MDSSSVLAVEVVLSDEVGLAAASDEVRRVAVLARRRLLVASNEVCQVITVAERMTLAVVSKAPGSVSLLFGPLAVNRQPWQL